MSEIENSIPRELEKIIEERLPSHYAKLDVLSFYGFLAYACASDADTKDIKIGIVSDSDDPKRPIHRLVFRLEVPEKLYLIAGRIANDMDDWWEEECEDSYGSRGEPDIGLSVAVEVPEDYISSLSGKTCSHCGITYSIHWVVNASGRRISATIYCECGLADLRIRGVMNE